MYSYELPARIWDMAEGDTITLREIIDAGDMPFKVDIDHHCGTEYAMINKAYFGMCADLIDLANCDAVEIHFGTIAGGAGRAKGVDLDLPLDHDDLKSVFELLEWQYVGDSALLDEDIYWERVEASRVEEWEFSGRGELAREIIKQLDASAEDGNSGIFADELDETKLDAIGATLEYEACEGAYWPSAEVERGAREYIKTM